MTPENEIPTPSQLSGNQGPVPAIVASLFWAGLCWASYYFCPAFALVGLVPFVHLATGPGRPGLRLLLAGLSGAVYFGVVEYWFALDSPAAWVTLAVLQSISLLPVALALRWSDRLRVPMALALPVFWVAGEYLRTLGPFGFPNGALGPVFFRWLAVIQIADLGGMFAVSFAAAAVSGMFVDLWRNFADARRVGCFAVMRPAFAVTFLWFLILGYGTYRLRESEKVAEPGPSVAVIQPDVPFARDVGDGFDPRQLFSRLLELSRQAIAQPSTPALLIWPESNVLPPLNEEFWQADPAQLERTVAFAGRVQAATDRERLRAWLQSLMQQAREAHQQLQTLADEAHVSLLVGAPLRVPAPEAPGEPWHSFNAAFLFRPHLPVTAQKKVHLFPMRERIPFIGTWAEAPFRWLAAVTNAAPEFELEPGPDLEPLEFTADTAAYRFTAPICCEIDLARTSGIFRTPAAKAFLVNISDDGIFQRSAMLRVRQSMLAYRAVESRSSLVRSANTGISCFVRPTGEIYGEVTNSRHESWTGRGFPERSLLAEVLHRKAHAGNHGADVASLVGEIRRLRAEAGVEGWSVQYVSLDPRHTLYSRVGDVFAQACTVALLLSLVAAWVTRTSVKR